MTHDQILKVLERKRREHPELRQPVDLAGLRRIMEREGVRLLTWPLGRPARLIQHDGAWAVVVSTRYHRRRWTYFVAHELAHLWLHVDAAGIDRWETVYHMGDAWDRTEEEDDAEFMAMCMLHTVRLEPEGGR